MTARREQRTAKRQRAANRAAWRKSGKSKLSDKRMITIAINTQQELTSAHHYRTMVRLHLSGDLPTYGRPRDWAQVEQEARRNAVLALRQWRFLGAQSLAGCQQAQVALAAIAKDAGLANPLEVNHDQANQSNHSRVEPTFSGV
jgi:hypothetical protein